MSERNTSIDIAKGLGIILVVFGHNWIIAHNHGELFRIIFSFHMPLFFFLSGAVLHQDTAFRDFLVFKADALLKPFFVVLSAWGLARIVLSGVDAHTYVLGMLYATGNTIEWVPLWYLPHLFLAMLLAWSVLHLANRVHAGLLLPVVCISILLAAGIVVTRICSQLDVQQFASLHLWLGNRQHDFPGLPWSLDLIGISTAFILLGYVMHDYVMRFRFLPWAFIVALLLFAALHFFFDETIDLNMREYGTWWIATAQALLGIYLALSVSACLQYAGKLGKLLAYLGTSSLFIMIFHSWIEWKVFALLARWNSYAYLNASLALLAGLLIPLLLLSLVKKYKFLYILLLPKAHTPRLRAGT
ncbi:acyltransferase family protein [Undibacterium sp.]|uniref:acyltransferase family protein n=1 Tax=Undibacterium sp. TaxID=1914977 RepID=UPI00273078DD|nr:acyltransferase family protein [Undibacterium sp.]MDP1976226.1 acyltransferase family protein [Undibacterium sp.]